MGFRLYRIALTDNQEKALLMIFVVAHDCDALKFLWIDGTIKANPEIRVVQFMRVVVMQGVL